MTRKTSSDEIVANYPKRPLVKPLRRDEAAADIQLIKRLIRESKNGSFPSSTTGSRNGSPN